MLCMYIDALWYVYSTVKMEIRTSYKLDIHTNHVYPNYIGINSLVISPRTHWEKCICPVCDEVMDDPILTSCGHHMCYKCFKKLGNSTQ